MTFRVKIDISAADQLFDGVAVSCEQAARPAAQAGAQVLYDEVLRNVARLRRHTGNLARSIYQVYSRKNSGQAHAAYEISWNAQKAPHGHLVEFGHLQRYEISFDPNTKRFITHKDKPLPVPRHVAARPFIRPARARMPAAEEAMRQRYLQELQTRGLLK